MSVDLISAFPRGSGTEVCPNGVYHVHRDGSVQVNEADLEEMIARGYYPTDPVLNLIVKGISMGGFFLKNRPTLTATMSATGYSQAFKPALGLPIYCSFTGTWQGRAKILRSVDGGATKQGRAMTADGWPPSGAWGGDGSDGIFNELPAETSPLATYYVYAELTSGSFTFNFHQ